MPERKRGGFRSWDAGRALCHRVVPQKAIGPRVASKTWQGNQALSAGGLELFVKSKKFVIEQADLGQSSHTHDEQFWRFPTSQNSVLDLSV
jgi:hypothetical protein